MVFRKPYGFLIKYFKVIHLFLTILYVYLAFKVNSLLTYYNHFISGTASKLDAIRYVTPYYMIAIVLSIVICAVIYALMKYKKKPRVFYFILIAFYFVVAMMIQLAYQGLNTIYISILEARTMLLYRDLLRILVIFQYISVGAVLVRGLGFDIKKFNFVEDLEDLQIALDDDEEVELTFGGINQIERKTRRKLRELKYYYLENRSFLNVILIVLAVIGFGIITVNVQFINKEYTQGETFSTDSFNFQVVDSYITNESYDGQMLTTTDTTFLVVRMNIGNRSEAQILNVSNLVLKVNNHNYTSNRKFATSFKDLGNCYQGKKISGSNTYLFIYNISKEDASKEMKLVYASDKVVKLKPILLDEVADTKSYKVGDTINLAQSSLKSGSFLIKSYEMREKFSYDYEYEVRGQVYKSSFAITSEQNSIIHLVIESIYPNKLDNYNFLLQYAKLVYKIGDKEYSTDVFTNKTPGNYKDGLYLAVDKQIKEATNIWLDIRIRNQKYLYTLK